MLPYRVLPVWRPFKSSISRLQSKFIEPISLLVYVEDDLRILRVQVHHKVLQWMGVLTPDVDEVQEELDFWEQDGKD